MKVNAVSGVFTYDRMCFYGVYTCSAWLSLPALRYRENLLSVCAWLVRLRSLPGVRAVRRDDPPQHAATKTRYADRRSPESTHPPVPVTGGPQGRDRDISPHPSDTVTEPR